MPTLVRKELKSLNITITIPTPKIYTILNLTSFPLFTWQPNRTIRNLTFLLIKNITILATVRKKKKKKSLFTKDHFDKYKKNVMYHYLNEDLKFASQQIIFTLDPI